MKYHNISEVPQYTHVSGYEVTIPFSSIERTLKDYVSEFSLNLNPDFQRGHVWSREQETAYVEFLLRGGTTARTIYFNHTRWHKAMLGGEFVIVDGFNRLTAIRCFLKGGFPVFGDTYCEDIAHSFRVVRDYLLFNINDLPTRAEVLRWYLEMNAGGVVHSPRELERVRALYDAETRKE